MMEDKMMSQAQLLEKRKADAKEAVIMLYKRIREEKSLVDKIDSRNISTEEREKLNNQLKIIANGKMNAK